MWVNQIYGGTDYENSEGKVGCKKIMIRIQEWLLFCIHLIVKMGFLGKYKLVSTSIVELNNEKGLKTLEKTIVALGKKNDTLASTLGLAKSEIAILEKGTRGLQSKLEYVNSMNIEAKKKNSLYVIEIGTLEKKIASLNSTLEQATDLSEKLQGEMLKWRT